MEKRIKAISASAGSGKTFNLTQTLLGKIKSRELNPENLVAVTFTEAGASELKSRIRAVLLNEGLFEEAQKVEEAYISTIHAFGFRLLKEMAFDMGLPLSSRMLNEDEQTQLIRSSMVSSQALIEMSSHLDTYGYKTQRKGNKFVSAEAVFRSHLQQFIDLLRSTGRHHAEEEFLNRSIEWIESRYGAVDRSRSSSDIAKAVHRCVQALLAEFPECPVERFQVGTESARKDFYRDYRVFEKAARFDPLLDEWSLWADLSNIRLTFQGSKGKPGFERYKELATSLKETVDTYFEVHPGPLDQSKHHFKSLLNGASETLTGYSEKKKKSALLDFTDMVAHAEVALRNVDNKKRLLDCIRMVVVDEFQDTNPIQFAFLWHLIGAGISSVLVGDVKQSIMGFQGADPRLFESLIKSTDVSVTSLDSNWRSQPRLMNAINALTVGLAGTDGMDAAYSPLEAKGQESPLDPLHILSFKGKPDSNRKKKDGSDDGVVHPSELQWRARNIANILRLKLQSDLQVVDRRTKNLRKLKGGDIAVLCPTNGMLAIYAREFEQLGLTVNLERQNWFETSEVQLAIQILSLIDNPDDRHAKLMLATSDFCSLSLEVAILSLLDGSIDQLPVFSSINLIRDSVSSLMMKDVVESALEQTGLIDLASSWVDHAQARANLFKLIGLAREFSDAHAETLASAGFHGKGIGTFIGWLHFLKAQRKDDPCPRATYNDENAIELTTWHKSKGREWPVVLVAGIDKSPNVGVPNAAIGYLDFSNFDSIIQNSQIEFSAAYDFEAKREALLATLRSQAESISLRELYVALSRPRDQLILEWLPYHLSSSSKSKRRIQLLSELTQFEVNAGSVSIGGQSFDAIVDEISYVAATTFVSNPSDNHAAKAVGRLAIEQKTTSTVRVLAQCSPSLMVDIAKPTTPYKIESVHPPMEFPQVAQLNRLGTAIHRVLEIVLSGHEEHLNAAPVMKAFELEGIDAERLKNLVQLAHKLRNHFTKSDCSSQIYVEQVVMGILDDREELMVGQVDCLIKTADGTFVIDHKSGSLSKDENSLWETYSVQLDTYGRLFEGADYSLLRVRSGEVLSASNSK